MARDATRNGVAQPATQIAEIARLALIDVFGDAARKHHPVDRSDVDRVGEKQIGDFAGERPLRDSRNQGVRHDSSDFVEVRSCNHIPALPNKPRAFDVEPPGRIETRMRPASSTTSKRPPMSSAAVATTPRLAPPRAWSCRRRYRC